MGMKTEVVTRELVNVVDDPDTFVIDAAAEYVVADVSDLEQISVFAVQGTDAGTVVSHVEYSPDGIIWIQQGANIIETDFAAGANAALLRTLSDANGMPISAKQVRYRASALAGGGVYKGRVCGFKRIGL